jgi:hypothetical protein
VVKTEAPAPARASGGRKRGYTITFRVTRLADGRIQAAHKVRLGYHDDLGTQVLDVGYSGHLISGDDELTPGPKLEAALRRFVSHEFEMVPRPVTVRVVYEGEGLESAGRGEASFVVAHYRRPAEDEEDDDD